MKESHKLNKSELESILELNRISYVKIKEKDLFGNKRFELYFRNEKDLDVAVCILNMKKFSNLFCKIVDVRINLSENMIYVIPFKS